MLISANSPSPTVTRLDVSPPHHSKTTSYIVLPRVHLARRIQLLFLGSASDKSTPLSAGVLSIA